MLNLSHPRSILLISLVLAIPTYGISLIVFYFFFKRPYDSRGASLILAMSKRCLETGMEQELFNINNAAIERVFLKFSLPHYAARYGSGTDLVRWGVIIHPMINEGKSFSLRVTKDKFRKAVSIEAAEGEDWRYLQEI